MRIQYRLTWADGRQGTNIRTEKVYDALCHFREKFPGSEIVKVEQRIGDGNWIDSVLLPTCQEEADALKDAPKNQQRNDRGLD